jgi:hydroxymethylbilane synthase
VSDPTESLTVHIATRASRLAKWQANHVAGLLRALPERPTVELVTVTTSGDQDRSQPLSEMGGVGVFTREVQRAVLDGRADIAVHSLKDLPTDTLPELVLAGFPARGPRHDVLVVRKGAPIDGLASLPEGARIGTGSLRRRAQLLHLRGDLEMREIRGNVETRIEKLDAGEFDAIVLAEAGLVRLGLAERIGFVLSPPAMYPAVGQAAIGIECRADDASTIALLAAISDARTRAQVTAERGLLSELRAGCHAPVGAWAELDGDMLRLEGVVLSADGQTRLHGEHVGPVEAAEAVGRELAAMLLEQGARSLIE